MHAAGTWMADVPVLYFCGMRASGRDTRNQTQFRTHVYLFMWVCVCVGHLTNVTRQMILNYIFAKKTREQRYEESGTNRKDPAGPGRTTWHLCLLFLLVLLFLLSPLVSCLPRTWPGRSKGATQSQAAQTPAQRQKKIVTKFIEKCRNLLK
jgi:ABC-type Fe3+ transport system permease subunit